MARGFDYGLDEKTREEIAYELYKAEKEAGAIELLTGRYPEITVDDAYAIQSIGLKLRLDEGAKIVGRKIGITSRGMMKMLNCDTPDYGCLLDRTEIPEGGAVRRSELNIPIVEGELAFIMGEDLNTQVVTAADIFNATSYVVPCFEVCDGRYPGWNAITVRDTISDNAGAARFMVGTSPRRLGEISPRNIGMVIIKNGELLGSAAGAEVMGSPVTSVVWLANKLLQYGDYLKKGDIVLSGAFMAADAASAGDIYTMELDGFPSISIRFV